MPLPRGTQLAIVVAVLSLGACTKAEKPVADTLSTAMAPVASPTPAGGSMSGAPSIALADVAGTWKVHSVPTSGRDTSPTNYTMTATGEPNGWKIEFANGLVVVPRVTTSGDSIIYDMGPYQSVRRKGVQVTTHGVLHKQGDKLVGTVVAHYMGGGADSVITLRGEGTKVK